MLHLVTLAILLTGAGLLEFARGKAVGTTSLSSGHRAGRAIVVHSVSTCAEKRFDKHAGRTRPANAFFRAFQTA